MIVSPEIEALMKVLVQQEVRKEFAAYAEANDEALRESFDTLRSDLIEVIRSFDNGDDLLRNQ